MGSESYKFNRQRGLKLQVEFTKNKSVILP